MEKENVFDTLNKMWDKKDYNYEEDTWDYEDTIEEYLLTADVALTERLENGDFEPGDIVMTNGKVPVVCNDSPEATFIDPHRIFIISSKETLNGKKIYKGFIMSSQVQKANKNTAQYPWNLYIKDYSTILDNLTGPSKEAFLNIADEFTVTAKNLSQYSYKGTANKEFLRFVRATRQLVDHGYSTADKYWEK